MTTLLTAAPNLDLLTAAPRAGQDAPLLEFARLSCPTLLRAGYRWGQAEVEYLDTPFTGEQSWLVEVPCRLGESRFLYELVWNAEQAQWRMSYSVGQTKLRELPAERLREIGTHLRQVAPESSVAAYWN